MAMTAGSPADEGLPERIGPYRIRRRIGQGGMGVVYQAVNSRDELVAIKVLRPEVAGDQIARARLAREVATMRSVHSENVAGVLDADTEAERPWVVTEYIPGPTLDSTVTDHGPLRGRALTRFVGGVARALKDIHVAGVVHRDLKPGNVIISNGEPIIIDFGIAHVANSAKLTQTGTFVGTPSYLSPEVIEGTDLGPATDVHAWGATTAFAATGRPPYGAGAFEVIFFRILNGEVDLDGIPDQLRRLVQRSVTRDMSERPSAAGLVAETSRLNLDLPLEGAEAYQFSGTTGSHTSYAPDAGLEHDRRSAAASWSEQPEVSDEPSTGRAEEAEATQVRRPDSTQVGDVNSTMVAPSGGADQTMVSAERTGALPGGEAIDYAKPYREPVNYAEPYEDDEGPSTHYFNSTLRPDEFRDILTPVDNSPQRGREEPSPEHTSAFQPSESDGERGYGDRNGYDKLSAYYGGHEDAEHEVKRLSSLILIPLLLALLGLTLMVPTLGLMLGVLVVSVLGALDTVRSEHSRRLMTRGPKNTDGMVAALSMPWALLRTLGRVLGYGLVYLLGGLIVGFIFGLTPFGESGWNNVGAYALVVVLALSFLGPNGGGARRQAVWLTERIGIRNPYVYWGSIVAVCLLALFFVVFGFQVAPDWRPMAAPAGWFA